MSSFSEKAQPFVIGGFSGCIATSIIQPMDMLKVRIQIKSEEISKLKAAGKSIEGQSVSPVTVFKEILSKGGVGAFYKGLDSALTRQVFYTTSRLGIYKTLFNREKAKNPGKDLSFAQKAFCGLTAGFFGAIIGNPADLALIRVQADTTLPPAERRNYKNVADAFIRIVKEEGLGALWKGCTPTVARAVALNFGMLAPYDEFKERINKIRGTKDTLSTLLTASAMAGFLASFLSLPFDNAKTKMQKMKPGPDGKLPYKSILDCVTKTAAQEGVAGLWVGFPTFYFRIAPHVMITLVVQDSLTKWVKKATTKN
jgi:solute carrier family 25 (mitochondrial oxoglutarate transporter), member 11